MPAVPPRYRGASDQASPDAGRDAVAGWERRRCGALFPFRRSKPRTPGHATVVRGPDGHAPGLVRSPGAHGLTPIGSVIVTGLKRSATGDCSRSKPSNTVRGTPWDLADLRLNGFRQASMSRGVEVRRSEHLSLRTLRKLGCARDPKRPARPRYLFESGGLRLRRGPARGRHKNTGDPPWLFFSTTKLKG